MMVTFLQEQCSQQNCNWPHGSLLTNISYFYWVPQNRLICLCFTLAQRQVQSLKWSTFIFYILNQTLASSITVDTITEPFVTVRCVLW